MTIQELIAQIEAKKSQLMKLRPIAPDRLKMIREKFRIAYNYHSNHLEWNSLTYQETRSLLLFGIVTWDKKNRRDYEEVKVVEGEVCKL